MILILSYSGGTVNQVMDWIYSTGETVHRINPYLENVHIKKVELSVNEIELYLEGYDRTVKLSDYKSIWIWHSNLWFHNSEVTRKNAEMNVIVKEVEESIKQHQQIMLDYIADYLSSVHKQVIGNYKVQNLNKLTVLSKAQQLGLSVPESFIVSKKEDIKKLLDNRVLITKPYHETIHITYSDTIYHNYTFDLTINNLDSLDQKVYPTLVQEKIEKLFEIRSFLLKGKFYSMAIFSQGSSQTRSDFRNYDYKKPNRTIPIELPPPIEKKLCLLFDELKLNSGSVDLIYSTNKEYIFLEINPVGQFGMVSVPCNYYLEKKMMETLMDE